MVEMEWLGGFPKGGCIHAGSHWVSRAHVSTASFGLSGWANVMGRSRRPGIWIWRNAADYFRGESSILAMAIAGITVP